MARWRKLVAFVVPCAVLIACNSFSTVTPVPAVTPFEEALEQTAKDVYHQTASVLELSQLETLQLE